MADHVDITLWIDRRCKNAIEKHLKGETLQEHLEDVLDTLCNQLPEQEYKRISAEIYAEDAAEREAREGARTYAAYHVTERGQEWYFKTSPGEELLVACKKLRGYVTAEKGTAPDKFIGMFFGGQPITAKEFDALTAVRIAPATSLPAKVCSSSRMTMPIFLPRRNSSSTSSVCSAASQRQGSCRSMRTMQTHLTGRLPLRSSRRSTRTLSSPWMAGKTILTMSQIAPA